MVEPREILLSKTSTLKRKCHFFNEITIIGYTGSCQNFQYSQWWKYYQNDNTCVQSICLNRIMITSEMFNDINSDVNGKCHSPIHVTSLISAHLNMVGVTITPWWRHQMETFSVLLAICAGNSPVTDEFPTQRPVTRSFDVIFDLRLNKRLSKQSWGWWFETLSRSFWRHCKAQSMLFVLDPTNMNWQNRGRNYIRSTCFGASLEKENNGKGKTYVHDKVDIFFQG